MFFRSWIWNIKCQGLFLSVEIFFLPAVLSSTRGTWLIPRDRTTQRPRGSEPWVLAHRVPGWWQWLWRFPRWNIFADPSFPCDRSSCVGRTGCDRPGLSLCHRHLWISYPRDSRPDGFRGVPLWRYSNELSKKWKKKFQLFFGFIPDELESFKIFFLQWYNLFCYFNKKIFHGWPNSAFFYCEIYLFFSWKHKTSIFYIFCPDI